MIVKNYHHLNYFYKIQILSYLKSKRGVCLDITHNYHQQIKRVKIEIINYIATELQPTTLPRNMACLNMY